MRPLPRRPRPEERREHARDGGPGAAGEIGDLHAERQRPLGRAVRREHARDREVVEVVPRPRRVRAVLAVAADRAEDDARVRAAERLEADAEPVHDAGPERLDDRVGAGGEAEERGGALRAAEVEGDGALVPLHGVERAGLLARDRREPAQPVAAVARLDLHDVRAEVGEDHRREGPGEEAAEVEDADAGERQHGRSAG